MNGYKKCMNALLQHTGGWAGAGNWKQVALK